MAEFIKWRRIKQTDFEEERFIVANHDVSMLAQFFMLPMMAQLENFPFDRLKHALVRQATTIKGNVSPILISELFEKAGKLQ